MNSLAKVNFSFTCNDYTGEWYAVDDNTYDGAPDSGEPVGSGKTKYDAAIDLLAQLYPEWT